MLTPRSIEKHLDHGRFEHLARDVARNGFRLGSQVKPGQDQLATPVAAVAAALIRLLEISYRPGPVACRLARFLLSSDAESGVGEGGGGGDARSPLGVLLVRTAMERMLGQFQRWQGEAGAAGLRQQLAAALDGLAERGLPAEFARPVGGVRARQVA